MSLPDYLKAMVNYEASDLYLTTGAPPSIKILGTLKALEANIIPPGKVTEIALQIMTEEQQQAFEQSCEINLAISEPGLGRFRANIFKQRGQTAMVIRHIKSAIPRIDSLNLPSVLKRVMLQPRGLVLFVGGTGSGKSTSLAALIDYRNAHASGHIITIEDPIEFIYQHKKSIINQREVGIDTASYEQALINAQRQAPDVIHIGEIRDRETMEQAIAYSETGHLVVSSLHTHNASHTLDRIINFFPDNRRHQLLMDLSINVKAIISQRLIKTLDNKQTAATEILLATPLISELILKDQIHNIKDTLEKSADLGMQTFDMAIFELYKAGKISADEALRNADSVTNLKLKINPQKNSPFENNEDGS